MARSMHNSSMESSRTLMEGHQEDPKNEIKKVKSKTRGCLKHWVYSSRYSHIARFLKNWSVPAQSCVSISYMEFQWLPDADPFHVLCVREDSVQGTLKLSKAKWSLFPC